MTICPKCGAELELGDWPYCEAPGGHGSIHRMRVQGFDPVVIHRDAQGNIRYPAHSEAPVPAGFQKVELRTVAEVRRFESEVNMVERVKADQSLSQRERAFSEKQAEARRDLRSRMAHMSEFGKDFARHAMENTNQRRPKSRDVGFHVDVFSNNSSNRETHRDALTDWKGRKA